MSRQLVPARFVQTTCPDTLSQEKFVQTVTKRVQTLLVYRELCLLNAVSASRHRKRRVWTSPDTVQTPFL